jgi:hypothetical protein
MKKWIYRGLILLALVGYGLWVYRTESVTAIEVIIGVILAVLGVIMAQMTRGEN